MLESIAELRHRQRLHGQWPRRNPEATMEMLESTTPGTPAGRQRGHAPQPPVCAASAALVLSGCVADSRSLPATTAGRHDPTSMPRGPATAGVPTTSAPLETTQASNKAPVYWIGRSNDNVFLYREFRDVPEQENPVTRALRAMMSEKPLDPDFFTPWQNPKKLATSISGKNVITVDVSAGCLQQQSRRRHGQAGHPAAGVHGDGCRCELGPGGLRPADPGGDPRRRAHRLPRVQPRQAGHPHVHAARAWWRRSGSSIHRRAWALLTAASRSADEARVPGGKLRWKILKVEGSSDKAAYLSGDVTASAEAAQSGLFSLNVNLAPGNYEVRVSQIDPGTPDREMIVDTRGFTVE